MSELIHGEVSARLRLVARLVIAGGLLVGLGGSLLTTATSILLAGMAERAEGVVLIGLGCCAIPLQLAAPVGGFLLVRRPERRSVIAGMLLSALGVIAALALLGALLTLEVPA
ncbi:MAG: hypothetical protein OEY14_11575 [Myxococcales bacterium]|nr:hypothetical protein [Myxococcales bacterium]